MLTILCCLVFWSKLERQKSSIRGGPHELTTNLKKKLSFWSVILSYSMQQRQTISWSDCDMRWKVDFIQQAETTSSVFKWRRCSKALPKAKLAPKKGHGHRPVAFCLSDPLQLSESWKNYYIWDVFSENWWDALKTDLCSWHWSTKKTVFSTTPDCTLHNQCSKSWMNWAIKFYLTCHIAK